MSFSKEDHDILIRVDQKVKELKDDIENFNVKVEAMDERNDCHSKRITVAEQKIETLETQFEDCVEGERFNKGHTLSVISTILSMVVIVLLSIKLFLPAG